MRKKQKNVEKILMVSRSVSYFTYFESIIDSLDKLGANVVMLFDKN
jgi:hypothetical protein